jgi:hypothetical protein
MEFGDVSGAVNGISSEEQNASNARLNAPQAPPPHVQMKTGTWSHANAPLPIRKTSSTWWGLRYPRRPNLTSAFRSSLLLNLGVRWSNSWRELAWPNTPVRPNRVLT